MLSRRRFLGMGMGGIGALAVASGCRFPGHEQLAYGDDLTPEGLRRRAELIAVKDRLLGYPINMNSPPAEFFAWRKQLFAAGVDAFAFNNVGNPFKESPIPYNTHDYEAATIREFGKLFGFPEDDTWGFLSHSGTDSNMHGMYMGRTLLEGRTGLKPNAYFTREAHYSVQILRDLLGMETVEVGTLADGAMDPDDLAAQLARHREAPALVVATIGTTFKGAIDNVDAIQRQLAGHPSYLHLDAALFGGYLPFTDHAAEVLQRVAGADRYDSIAVSCHKFFGFPSPAGLYVMRRSVYDEFNDRFSRIHNPEYIDHVPGTITCSRDAVKPAEFFYFTTPPARARQVADAKLMLANAEHLLEQLRSRFPQLGATRANALSNTVYFRCPSAELVKKYSLATMHLERDGKSELYSHVVVMPHVSRDVLTEFLEDVAKA